MIDFRSSEKIAARQARAQADLDKYENETIKLLSVDQQSQYEQLKSDRDHARSALEGVDKTDENYDELTETLEQKTKETKEFIGNSN